MRKIWGRLVNDGIKDEEIIECSYVIVIDRNDSNEKFSSDLK